MMIYPDLSWFKMMIYLLKLVISHSYVKQSEGMFSCKSSVKQFSKRKDIYPPVI